MQVGMFIRSYASYIAMKYNKYVCSTQDPALACCIGRPVHSSERQPLGGIVRLLPRCAHSLQSLGMRGRGRGVGERGGGA